MTDDQRRDKILAFTWHVAEFVAVLSLIGLIWSWKHLAKTSVEIERENAEKRRA